MANASVICVRVFTADVGVCHLVFGLLFQGERGALSTSCLLWRGKRVEQEPDKALARA